MPIPMGLQKAPSLLHPFRTCFALSCICRQLYQYYHEAQPSTLVLPSVPDWKAGDSPDRGDDEVEEDAAANAHMEHDDLLGEEVSWGT